MINWRIFEGALEINAYDAKKICSCNVKTENVPECDFQEIERYHELINKIFFGIKVLAYSGRNSIEIRCENHNVDPNIIKEYFKDLGYHVYARRYRIGTPEEFTKMTINW